MPSRAKTTMNRKRRKSKLMMDFMELSRDTTRLRRDAQYLTRNGRNKRTCLIECVSYYDTNMRSDNNTITQQTHLVTLKILNNLRARSTLMPNDVPGWMMDHRTSNMLPHITWCRHKQVVVHHHE